MERKMNLAILFFMFGAVVASSATPANGQAAKVRPPAQSWQNSWDRFIDHLGGCAKRNTNCNELGAKVVTWEGIVDTVRIVNEKPVLYIDMNPRTITMHDGKKASINGINLEIPPPDVEMWKQMPKGTKVRFRTTLKRDAYWVFPTASGDLVVLIGTGTVKLVR